MRAILAFGCLAAVAAAQHTVDFVRDVAPILRQRCVRCHGPDKQKGDLRLDRREFLFHGESDTWDVQPGEPDRSELLARVRLPADDDDVMPNEGEPLTAAQIETLHAWIAAGAEWPAAGDEYFAAQAAAAVPRLDFGIAAPDAATQQRIDLALAALHERGVAAQRVAEDTPAVDVNASLLGRAFGDGDLHLLRDLAPVLVWLDLSRTAVTDDGLAALAGLPQLRRIGVANTAIGDAGLAALAAPPSCEVLNAYGSRIGDAGLQALRAWPALRRVYAFATAVTAEGAAALQQARADIAVDRGDYAERRLRDAEADILARKLRDQPVNALCPLTGEPVVAGQVVEHEGLRIGFCCAKCRAKFTEDPARYAEKVAEYRAAAARQPAAQQPATEPPGSRQPGTQPPATETPPTGTPATVPPGNDKPAKEPADKGGGKSVQKDAGKAANTGADEDQRPDDGGDR